MSRTVWGCQSKIGTTALGKGLRVLGEISLE